MATYNIIEQERDGFYHPKSEEQIIALVKKAYQESLQVRVRGAAHSLAWAIYTDPGKGEPHVPNTVSEQKPPSGPNINIMLNNYKELEWIDGKKGIVEVQAGIHLGLDPEAPTGDSPLRESFLFQIYKGDPREPKKTRKRWALNDLGGITHQTVSGFLMTGSSGGTLMYYLDQNILAFRVIDGTGMVRWIEKKRDKELFNAVALSMGLLGIISKVRFQLTEHFYIYGQEATFPIDSDRCPIDLFGSGTWEKPSMSSFLKKTPYSRILWWPQKGVDRIAVWGAVRGSLPVISPIKYQQFGSTTFSTQLEELGGAILFTLLGNKGFFNVWFKLGRDFRQYRKNMKNKWQSSLGMFFGWLLAALLTFILQVLTFPIVLFFSIFRGVLLWLYPKIVDTLEPLTEEEGAKAIMDYMWRSLPMDNGADDILMGTEFTELWVPLRYTEKVMTLLKKQFDEKGHEATGYYATELYAGVKSDFWLSPGYKTDTFRVDFFWHINNDGNPAAKGGYYSQFWELLRKEKIPFRLHWGKFLPEYDYKEWAEYFRSHHPRWDDFMKLRAKRDPKNIFLTSYWRRHLFGEES